MKVVAASEEAARPHDGPSLLTYSPTCEKTTRELFSPTVNKHTSLNCARAAVDTQTNQPTSRTNQPIDLE
jgi:hypothetical protein